MLRDVDAKRSALLMLAAVSSFEVMFGKVRARVAQQDRRGAHQGYRWNLRPQRSVSPLETYAVNRPATYTRRHGADMPRLPSDYDKRDDTRPETLAKGSAEWDFPRASTGVVLLLNFATDNGVRAAACLANTGIEPSTLCDPYASVEASQEIAVIRNLLNELGNRPALGLEFGARHHLSTYGIYGYALMSSPTVRDVVRTGLRYAPLSGAYSRITAEVNALGQFVMRMQGQHIPADVRQFLVERDCATTIGLHREMFAGAESIPLRHVDMSIPTDSETRYAYYFGAPVSYGHSSTALYFDGSYLDRRLPQGNLHTSKVCTDLCQRLLSQRTADNGVARAVRKHLTESGTVDVGMERVAKQLHMTSRTLRRKLIAEGTTYRRLIDEVRLVIAQDTLCNENNLSASELAHRLGYSEPSSFRRAFRRWTGESWPVPFQDDGDEW